MNNYKITLSYDGTLYAGWQIQKNAVTVQQKISDALSVLLKEKVNLIGSGRTDSGVHAIGQVANFVTGNELDLYRFTYSLNSMLPRDIAIKKIENVEESFNSRFDARKRSYLYFIVKNKNPFWDKFAYRNGRNFDVNYLNRMCRCFIGENNFTSFCRTRSETENKICFIYDAFWRRQNDFLIFKIEGSRFLHGMVRAITGTILNAEKNNLDESYIKNILISRNREAASESVPAHGLFLYKVKY
ncbi:MAG: tRNA pseudouridine(38-40) synthase TruA [Ignavibacteriaceae bacterium]|nr:tRNA pseudouridine(38-40) synthase TruA [Ignavibacteriaceae bacterium]